MMEAVAEESTPTAPDSQTYPVARDLREFLDILDRTGGLVRISKPVSTEFEIAAYIRRSSYNDGPSFIFENVNDYPNWTVAGGTYATLRRVYQAIGAGKQDAVLRYMHCTENPIPPTIVQSGPVKEVTLSRDEIDLRTMPFVKHCEKDSGLYITAGVQVAKDPDGSVQHLGIHRMMLQGPRQITFWGGGERRLRRAITKHEELGLDTPMAVVIGGPPAFVLASCARIPHRMDKHAIASAIQSEPLELVPCDTLDLAVPAHSEIVMEGHLPAGERLSEAPFGEFTGCYGHRTDSPVFHVERITMRRNAILQDFLTGFPICEDQALMYLPRCSGVYQDAARAHPEVKAVHWQVDTGNIYGVVISIRKRLQTEAYNVMSMVLGGPTLVKQVIVVDEDVDVFDPVAVQWALSTRVQPHRDIHIFPTMVGAPLDPSAVLIRQTSKIGYDATIPLDEDRAHYERVYVPGEDVVEW